MSNIYAVNRINTRLKNGQAFQFNGRSSARANVDGVCTLTIQKASHEESALFACVVTDAGETAKTEAEVIVMEKEELERIQFTKKLVDQTVPKSSQLVLEIAVDRQPKEVKWLSVKTYRLTINDTQPDDSGFYHVKVSDDAGVSESKANIVVEDTAAYPPLRIIKGLNDTRVNAGSKVILEIETEGQPSTVKWYKGSNEIVEHKGRIMEKISSTRYRLTLLNVQTSDEDTYKDGHKIDECAKFTMRQLTDGQYALIISKPSENDEGTYTFTAQNEEYSISSQAALKVLRKEEVPKEVPEVALAVLKDLEDLYVPDGGKAVLEVVLNKQPKVVKWYRNGQELIDRKNTALLAEDAKCSLIISNVTTSDIGTYKFVALDTQGKEVVSEAKLFLKEPGEKCKFIKELEDQTVPIGVSLVLDIEVDKAPKSNFCDICLIEIQRYKAGDKMQPSDRVTIEKLSDRKYRLVVKDVQPEDAGTYRVEVEDERITLESQAKVTVQGTASVVAPAFSAVLEVAKSKKLRIVKGLEDQTAKLNSNVVLQLEVEGLPESVKWYKGTEKISDSRLIPKRVDDSHYILTIHNFEISDAGVFSVFVSDGKVSLSSQATVTPEVPEPKLLKVLEDLENVESESGKDVSFVVKIEGVPDTNGEKLEDSAKYAYRQTDGGLFLLLLSKVDEDDEGVYSFKAETASSSAKSQACLKIKKPGEEELRLEEELKITKMLENASVIEGGTIDFIVHLNKEPKEIKWYRNGQLLSPTEKMRMRHAENKYTLAITVAEIEDAGTYKFEAFDGVKVVSSEAEATVEAAIQAPQLVKELSNISCEVGDEAVFEAVIKGDVKSIKWFGFTAVYKNGSEISPSAKVGFEVVGEGRCLLRLKDVSEASAGLYRVMVSNDAGFKDDTPLPVDMCRATVAGTKSIYEVALPHAGLEVAGAYKAVASNESSSLTSNASVTIKGSPPIFKRSLYDRRIPFKAKIILEVEVDKKPKTVKWYKDGKPLKENDRVYTVAAEDTVFQLMILECRRHDAASYKVEVSNDFGSSVSEGKLVLDESEAAKEGKALKIVTPLSEVTAEEDDKVSLLVGVEGNPSTIKWSGTRVMYKNGREIKDTPSCYAKKCDNYTYKLIFPKCSKDDEGLYLVQLSNDSGSVSSEARLNLHGSWGTIPSSYVLKIIKSQKDDAGAYMCMAQNIYGSDKTECTLMVKGKPGEQEEGTPPEFVKPMRSKTVFEGEDMVIEVCVVSANISILRFINNREILPSDRIVGKIECISDEVFFRLRIKNAQLSDTGMYKCVATNIFGSASSEGKITVEALKPSERSPPKFIIPLRDTSVYEGKDLVVEVKVRGSPVPRLTWFKNGIEIVPSDRVRIEELGGKTWSLTIINTQPDDAGYYECKAQNVAGTDESNAYFTVKPSLERQIQDTSKYAPVFNVPLHDRIIPEGSTMTVECFVDAKPRATIKWFKDNIPLDENDHVHIETYSDGKCRLSVLNFSINDVGCYQCMAQNEVGSASTSALLSVDIKREKEKYPRAEHAPRFIRYLSDQKVDETADVKLTCQVSGVPIPEIRWYKDGIPLAATSKRRIEMFEDGTCSMEITGVRAEDVGAYRCVASNIHGSASTACTLTVSGRWQIDFKNDYFRYKNGRLLRSSDNITLKEEEEGVCTLHIQNTDFSNEGLYRCVAENAAGSSQTSCTVKIYSTRLELKQPYALKKDEGAIPQVIEALQNVKFEESQTLKLSCRFSGRPVPHMAWYKDSLPLVPREGIRTEELSNGVAILTIANASSLDAGGYKCVAVNEFGSATTKCLATFETPKRVREVPTAAVPASGFVYPLHDMRIVENQNLLLECKYAGPENPDFVWYFYMLKDGEVLPMSDRVTMTVKPDGTVRLLVLNAVRDDEGFYRCVAKSGGRTLASTKATVTVTVRALASFEAVPVPSREVRHGKAPYFVVPLGRKRLVQGQDLFLTCTVSGDPVTSTKW
ncbi:unnamed protein product [Soboliphyme baturini]|uniref:Ig-like domain-containing protein n=1 Tax=Soboliphyme baturini TaxID=241478 RepID=A0A183IK75_9BILA|nr:unnamed protein product [Soboliphyme baturini]